MAMMNGDLWFDKYKSSPMVDRFYEIFGGFFIVNVESNILMYEPSDSNKSIYINEDENKFWTKVLQSIEKRKNLFIE